ncbi:uncharacterized protein CIMG_02805 [Coccidioides immitis RS]|uniref:Uncharacterized protein n=4 Tax=Coccidioides immitis TaxID=5501 RepID=J3KM56_COCIM|nr:uncharacterized protein CIMG_02805 [Coccidioides immitis RS]EAS37451.3 hypothetical protein CIMG_02805 [Coccidioides immitis RS]KMP02277.1 hypothetical protein CIRG_10101 [Coccidioides immitis RMSCC 2394]KMU79389.1 hypothetical protein CISG_07793 [Coccidioides immitis RMSCC 3703]KMU90078.1 hypothetical protein CIHG_07888 [Coccidioides immitis H538.4]
MNDFWAFGCIDKREVVFARPPDCFWTWGDRRIASRTEMRDGMSIMIRERPISPEGVYSTLIRSGLRVGSFVERREETHRPPRQVRRLHKIHGVAAPEPGPKHALAVGAGLP